MAIPARPWRPFPRGALALGRIRHSSPLPLPPRRGWRCADPGASHPSAAAAAGGDPVTFRASPSSTAGAGGRNGGGVPVYGGIVYCQHAILECGFIDQ